MPEHLEFTLSINIDQENFASEAAVRLFCAKKATFRQIPAAVKDAVNTLGVQLECLMAALQRFDDCQFDEAGRRIMLPPFRKFVIRAMADLSKIARSHGFKRINDRIKPILVFRSGSTRIEGTFGFYKE